MSSFREINSDIIIRYLEGREDETGYQYEPWHIRYVGVEAATEIYENNLEKRAKEKTISIEDDFIQKATFEELKKAIEMLPKVQKRRVKKYYFQDMGEIEIANQEGVSQKNVSETLKAARKNLKKFLEKFN